MVLFKFLHLAAQHSISKNQKPSAKTDGGKANGSLSLLQQMPPGVQVMYFIYAQEFFNYHWNPNRLVLMKSSNYKIKVIVGTEVTGA